MHTFQINTLIKFFNFWRLLPISNLMDSSPVSQLYTQLLYGMFTCIGVSSLACGTLFHLLDGVYSCLLEHESMKFEICGRHKKLYNRIKVLIWKVCISLVHVVLLYNNARYKTFKNIKLFSIVYPLESESNHFLQIRSIKLEEIKLSRLILCLFTGRRGGKSGKMWLWNWQKIFHNVIKSNI